MEPDFGGYATKADIKCRDGRTISPQAFTEMNGKRVPLVWQHGHDSPDNVLGHAMLETRDDGVYANAFFNKTPRAQNTKLMVEHGDITALSIYANGLVEKSKRVLHGMIREVSLVLAGANPGALIDYVNIAHGDGDFTTLEDEAVIYTGLSLVHGDSGPPSPTEPTISDVYESLDEKQKELVHYLVNAALESSSDETSGDGDATHSAVSEDKTDSKEDDKSDLKHTEGTDNVTTRNVFEQNGGADKNGGPSLTHDDIKQILTDAERLGSMKAAVEGYAVAHGIESIDLLFPDAKNLTDTPQWDKRRTEWVASVLDSCRKTPFSRVKTLIADITQDEARARGYVKGNLKKEEWFGLTKRTTGPTTIYKKQKLDRDDIVDITDFDVVLWIKGEMRLMLEEECAVAILISDGREVDDDDKVKDPAAAADGNGIRSILHDHELFATTVNINIDDANSNWTEVVEAILRNRKHYKGSGQPTFYTTDTVLTGMLLTKDTLGRRLWRTVEELAQELRVAGIVVVEPMERETDLIGILVNLTDYNIGADRGGEVSFFDDFDLDYNQYKYLLETRFSGALAKIKSAIVVKRATSTDVLVAPTAPTMNKTTFVVTIPTKTGVVYKNAAGDTLTAGAQTALSAGTSLVVTAFSTTGYFFENNAEDQWTFKRPAA